MKRIFLFIALFLSSLKGMETFSSESCEGDTPSINIFSQESPKFWRIRDKKNPYLNYTATETSIKIILNVLKLLIETKDSELVNNLYLSSIFISEKICIEACKQNLPAKILAKLMILIKKDGTIKTEWIRNLISYSILFEENNKLLTFEELVKNKVIIPIKEENKISFWKIDDKTFAIDTIKYVIFALKQLYEKNYSTIVKLKKICDQEDTLVSPDLAKILRPYRFVKANRTLNLWAKIITSKVLYQHSKCGIQIHNIGYLEGKNIITPCQNNPTANQEINDFDSDIISSELILKEEEEYNDKKNPGCPNITFQLNSGIMQENTTTCTNKSKINYNNSN